MFLKSRRHIYCTCDNNCLCVRFFYKIWLIFRRFLLLYSIFSQVGGVGPHLWNSHTVLGFDSLTFHPTSFPMQLLSLPLCEGELVRAEWVLSKFCSHWSRCCDCCLIRSIPPRFDTKDFINGVGRAGARDFTIQRAPLYSATYVTPHKTGGCFWVVEPISLWFLLQLTWYICDGPNLTIFVLRICSNIKYVALTVQF